MAIYGIVGTGGLGIESLMAARREVNAKDKEAIDFVLVDLEVRKPEMYGAKVLTVEQFLSIDDTKRFAVGISDSVRRRKVFEEFSRAGARPFSINAPTSIRMEGTHIDHGCILTDNTMVMPGASIGTGFYANIYSYVGHDSEIGDFVTFAPKVSCNGHVKIGNNVYVGAGASIRNGCADRPIVIGAGAVIGMGAVVTKDVAPGQTVIGNPAKPLKQREEARSWPPDQVFMMR